VQEGGLSFNRAVIFDTTQDSWPGLTDAMRCPRGVICKSLAVYYLTAPRSGAAERGKALFAPHGEQKNDSAVLELIKKDRKLLRQKKLIESILEKRRKKLQGKNPLFVCEKGGREQTEKRISFAKDHLGHDWRHAINGTKSIRSLFILK
jgi:hypothetical protein